jgi:hypothetical protein
MQDWNKGMMGLRAKNILNIILSSALYIEQGTYAFKPIVTTFHHSSIAIFPQFLADPPEF